MNTTDLRTVLIVDGHNHTTPMHVYKDVDLNEAYAQYLKPPEGCVRTDSFNEFVLRQYCGEVVCIPYETFYAFGTPESAGEG